MSIIPLTVFFSLLLSGLFIVLFAYNQRRRCFHSAERDSLLPLADEAPRVVTSHHHHPAGEGCGCRDGIRPPCAGCRRVAVRPAALID